MIVASAGSDQVQMSYSVRIGVTYGSKGSFNALRSDFNPPASMCQ